MLADPVQTGNKSCPNVILDNPYTEEVKLLKPKLILFDEPLAGVDYLNSKKLIQILDNYLKPNSISAIIVEHKGDGIGIFSSKIKMYLGTIKS